MTWRVFSLVRSSERLGPPQGPKGVAGHPFGFPAAPVGRPFGLPLRRNASAAGVRTCTISRLQREPRASDSGRPKPRCRKASPRRPLKREFKGSALRA